MEEQEQNRRIAEFVEVSQSSPDEAQELLEASNWDVQDALSAYYRGSSESAGPHNASSAWSSGNRASSPDKPPSRPSSSTRRFATIHDFSGGSSGKRSPSNSDDDLFAGGEKSGLAVQNPDQAGDGAGSSGPSGGPNSRRLIETIMRQAAEPLPEDDSEEPQRAPGEPFRGSGYTLGSDDAPSRLVPGQREEQPLERVKRHVTFWKDGFSIEDGPLYRYDDPANVEHLRAMNSGSAPLSLMNVQVGQTVDVVISRRLDEEYKAPKGGFQGQGQRLGSPVPGDAAPRATPPSSGSPAPSTAAGVPQGTSPANAGGNSDGLPGVGDAIVMIRLADGRSFKCRFVTTGPVQQIYDYLDANSPTSRPYVLQTTFPNRELNDRHASIEQLKLKGAVVVQKWV